MVVCITVMMWQTNVAQNSLSLNVERALTQPPGPSVMGLVTGQISAPHSHPVTCTQPTTHGFALPVVFPSYKLSCDFTSHLNHQNRDIWAAFHRVLHPSNPCITCTLTCQNPYPW